ncbi:MAG: PKD domain-containing protein [Flavobacteriales bacterium]|nr:PKD domain-containing protein [Flavobacteriales bacterium]
MHKIIFKSILVVSFLVLTKESYSQLQANFSANTTSGCEAISNVQFTDLSSGSPVTWFWDFGNGNTSTLQNPIANYTSIGTYSVSLKVTNGVNEDTEIKTNFIRVYKKPIASISVGSHTGCPPLPVTFISTSTPGDGALQSYIWDFGDGSPAGTTKTVTHTYQTGGIYPVSLQVFDINGCSNSTTFNSVQVTKAPTANFSAFNSTSACTIPYTVNFNNTSSGSGLSHLWNFGDGNTSTQASPTHTYTTLGKYTVSLKVSDSNCSDTQVATDFVKLENVNAEFNLGHDTICFGQALNITNLSTGASSYLWDFGNNTNASKPNPTVNYSDSGWFQIKLLATNGATCTSTKIDSIYVQKVKANYISNKHNICNNPDTIQLTASGYNVSNYSWSYYQNDTLRKSSGSSLEIIQVNKGIFSDTLFAKSAFGCVDTVVNDSNRIVRFMKIKFQEIYQSGCMPLKVKHRYYVFGTDSTNQWNWNFGNGDSSQVRFPDSITYDTAGSYEAKLITKTPYGCIAEATALVEVGTKQIPNFFIQYDTICPKDTIFITDLSSDTSIIENRSFTAKTQEFDLGAYDSTFQHVYFTNFQDTGYYSVELKVIDRGCEAKLKLDSMFFVDGPIGEIDFIANCQNRLQTQFLGTIKRATRFYWDFGDGSPLDSINQNPNHSYQAFGVFNVKLSIYNDSSGCPAIIDSIKIDLNPPPLPQIITVQKDMCINTVSRSTYSPIGYYRNPFWLIGDTLSDSLVFLDSNFIKGQKIVTLRLNDYLGCPYTLHDTIRTYDPKADFTSNSGINCVPFNVNFRDASLVDTNIVSYQWDFGNGSTSNLKNPTTSYLNFGAYDVSLKIGNAFGCYDSILKPDYILSARLDAKFREFKTKICQGESIFFRNESIAEDPVYAWNFGDNSPINNQTNPTHTFNKAGVFTVTLNVTDSNGCTASYSKPNLIVVEAKPIADFSSDTSKAKCYPLAVNFTDQSIGNINTWNWKFGDQSSSIFQNPFHNYTLPGNYDVELMVETINGCKDTVLKPQYIQTKGPVASFTKDKDSICINESVRFEILNSTNTYSYSWDFGDGSSAIGNPINHTFNKTGTLYPTLILSDSSGQCIVPIKDTLFIQNVFAEFDMSDSLGCEIPYTVNFTNQSVGASQFNWLINNTAFNNNNPSFTFNQYGVFNAKLIINSNIGCKDTLQKSIVIAQKPIPIVSPDTGLCLGDTVLLQASGAAFYEWKPNYNLSAYLSASTLAYPDSSTIYQVILKSTEGCTDSASVEVIVPKIPLGFTINDTSLIIGEQILGNIYVGKNFNYRWSPPDGLSCTDCYNPTIQPLQNRTYFIHIFDDFGCFNILDTLNVSVDEKYSLDVPKAFSPNGDHINDVIFAKGWGLKELIAFKIYNRFGELIFESNQFEVGWDGTYKGNPQAIETYVYTVEALTFGNKVLSKKGNITLIR